MTESNRHKKPHITKFEDYEQHITDRSCHERFSKALRAYEPIAVSHLQGNSQIIESNIRSVSSKSSHKNCERTEDRVITTEQRSRQKPQIVHNRQASSSPNRHRHGRCSPNEHKVVTYGELQIILKSIEDIKKKAKHENRELQVRNRALSKQLQAEKEANSQNKHCIAELRLQNEKLLSERLETEKRYSAIVREMSQKESEWQSGNEHFLTKISQLHEQISQLSDKINSLEQSLDREVRDKEQQSNEYHRKVSKLTNGQTQRFDQLLYQLQTKYMGKSVLDLLSDFEKEKINLRNEVNQETHQKNLIERRLLEFQDSQTRQEKTIEKLAEENHMLVTKIENIKSDFEKDRLRLAEAMEGEEQSVLKTQEMYEALVCTHRQKLEQIDSLRQYIEKLEATLVKVREESASLKRQKKMQKENDRYFCLVDELCGDLQECGDILNRLRVSEMHKVENRNNIEKIQFLCKMLDNY